MHNTGKHMEAMYYDMPYKLDHFVMGITEGFYWVKYYFRVLTRIYASNLNL